VTWIHAGGLEENIINMSTGTDLREFAFPPLPSIAQPKPPALLNSCVPTPS